LVFLIVLLTGTAAAWVEVDLGPFFFAGEEDGERTVQVLGPLWESRAGIPSGTRFVALRPFYAQLRIKEGTAEVSVTDTLWPFGTAGRRGNSRRWRFFPIFGYDRDVSDPNSPRYVWVMPIVFSGKDQEGVPYLAVFPLGGTIRDVLARDRICFVLFPLYVGTSGRGRETWDFLWPIFSRTTGDRVRKWRVFPVYGEATWEAESKSGFVFWPIYTWKRSLVEGHPGRGYMVFPLYGAVDTPQEKRRLYLWPFFRYRRVEEGREVDFPWPFLRYSSVPDVERLHVWPLWGRTRVAGEERHFFLWPVFRSIRREGRERETTRVWAFPLAWRFLHLEHGETREDYRRVWPLMSSWEHDGRVRTRALDPWPWKNTRGVEWNWAPFWTVAETEREGEAYSADLLWGLVRSRRDGEERRRFSLFPLWDYDRKGKPDQARTSWSILKGLVGVKAKETGTETRLFWFLHFGHRHDGPEGTRAGRSRTRAAGDPSPDEGDDD